MITAFYKNIIDKLKTADLRRNKLGSNILLFVLGLSLFLLLLQGTWSMTMDLQVGDFSPENIITKQSVEDYAATTEARKTARDSVVPLYRVDAHILVKKRSDIDQLIFEAKRLNDEHIAEEILISSLQEASNIDLSLEVFYRLLQSDDEKLDNIRAHVREIITVIMSEGLVEADLESARIKSDELIIGLDASKEERFLIKEILDQTITANLFLDETTTAKMRDSAENQVNPIMIPANSLIVAQGDIITQEIYNHLLELQILETRLPYLEWLGVLLLVLAILTILYYYMQKYFPQLFLDNKKLALFVVVWIITFVIIHIFSISAELLVSSAFGYAVPLAMGTMLITILLSSKAAVFSAVVFSIIVSYLFSTDPSKIFDYQYGLVGLISGMFAVFVVSKMTHRSAIMRAGIMVAFVNAIVIASLSFIRTGFSFHSLSIDMLHGVIAGLLAAVLTIGILPYLESSFGIMSPVSLLELSNPNHPLLKKLLLEAPGTYHHSVMVGNLAEAAAEVVDADPLLARVGAFYHDIGKTRRPTMFIENQMTKDNPHDKISPEFSAAFITTHPGDGIELAKKHKLPEAVCDIIFEHHGTSLLGYFLHKAKEANNGEVEEASYRYPCRKPQSKESAIVMMADAAEAAVKSLGSPDKQKIESMIRKIMREKLLDGQFDECDLTFRDLDKMVKAFMQVLKGIYHTRIEYPEAEKEEVLSSIKEKRK